MTMITRPVGTLLLKTLTCLSMGLGPFPVWRIAGIMLMRDYTVSRFRLGSLLVTLVCSVVSLGELPTASPP